MSVIRSLRGVTQSRRSRSIAAASRPRRRGGRSVACQSCPALARGSSAWEERASGRWSPCACPRRRGARRPALQLDLSEAARLGCAPALRRRKLRRLRVRTDHHELVTDRRRVGERRRSVEQLDDPPVGESSARRRVSVRVSPSRNTVPSTMQTNGAGSTRTSTRSRFSMARAATRRRPGVSLKGMRSE